MQSRVPLGPGKFHIVVLVVSKIKKMAAPPSPEHRVRLACEQAPSEVENKFGERSEWESTLGYLALNPTGACSQARVRPKTTTWQI